MIRECLGFVGRVRTYCLYVVVRERAQTTSYLLRGLSRAVIPR
jgi:hypothetical protein